jgi:hypothetical protein
MRPPAQVLTQSLEEADGLAQVFDDVPEGDDIVAAGAQRGLKVDLVELPRALDRCIATFHSRGVPTGGTRGADKGARPGAEIEKPGRACPGAGDPAELFGGTTFRPAAGDIRVLAFQRQFM